MKAKTQFQLPACNRCGQANLEDYMCDLENCPDEVWKTYNGDTQDIALAWDDAWGYICESCAFPPSPYEGLPRAKRLYLEAKDSYDEWLGGDKAYPICPECGYQFSNDWRRLKQHWQAKHSATELWSDQLQKKITRYQYFEK